MRNHFRLFFGTLRFLLGLAIVVAGVCQGQQTPQPIAPIQAATNPVVSDYAIAQVGPHSRVWQNSSGQSVTEIATGMNYLNAQGQWTPSVNAFAVSQDGNSFIADQIQDPTQLAANINQQAAVTAVTPEGVTMRSTPTAIVLYDAATGLSAIVGTITNSIGVLVDNQHIVYTNAFSSSLFSASVVYSLPDTGSFHQDVIFTGFDTNFDPTAYGFAAGAANTLQIEVMTEFINPPQPMAQERDLYIEQDPNLRASMASPDQIDYTLDFGHYVFGPGRAYTTSSSPGAGAGVVVTKDFVTTNGRSFLIESTSLKSIAGYLNTLPAPKPTASLNPPPSARKRMVAWEGIPALKKNAIQAKAMKIAGLMPSGFDVDYIATVSSTVEPKLYSSDTTYFVSGNVYESSAVTMESAVFKYPTSAGRIEIASTLTLATTNYRTAIFTSADDPTAGATLSTNIWSGYTGTPSGNRYGSQALLLNSSASAITLNNLRFCYMNLALQINADMAAQTLTMWHSQFVDCYEGVYVDGGNGSNTNDSLTFNLYNCLFTDVGTSFEIGGIVIAGNAYNCTDDSSTDLVTVDAGTTVTGNFRFTNSIFSTLASKGTLGSLSLGGGSNAFYNCGSATFGSFNTLPSSPYVTNGAGYFYITNYISYLTNGSTAVPSALQTQLEMKTTQAPLSLTNIFSYSTIITPIIPRDTNGTWLGFHYDSIDFLTSFILGPHTVTLTNGVALGYYQIGISMTVNSSLYSQGTPINRNYIAYYSGVQEQPKMLGVNNVQALPILPDPSGSGNFPFLSLRLTTICVPVGETNLFDTGDSGSYQGLSAVSMRDCEIYGSGANWQMSETNNTPSVVLTNNLFYRVPFAINSAATITAVNNLFYGTTNYITNISVSGTITTNTSTLVSIQHLTAPSPNTNQNNVYDGVSVTLDGSTVGYNAYLHGAVATLGGKSTDLTNNVTWVGGPLGTFYQPSGSPLLNNGSESAANLGLYHYTVLASEAIEGASTVSRGYHYVALSSGGTPLDNNSDGYPDYLADANGDGTNNDSEAWTGNTAAWIAVQPLNQYAVPGTPATFSITAYGTATLTYQWYKNDSSISGATTSGYTISSVGSSDAATYYVIAVNAYGSATSSSAILTIVSPQISTYSPQTNVQYWYQQAYDPLSVTLLNPFYGSSTPSYYSQYLNPYLLYANSYQWLSNGTTVASGSSYGNPAVYVATGDSGTYSVVITNDGGSTNVTWTNIIQANPGMVETWGANTSGECNRPVTMTNVAAIAAGTHQSIVSSDSGVISQWGQYSDGSTLYNVTDTIHATQPPTNATIAVAAGLCQGLALTTSNNMIAWGLISSQAATFPLGLSTNNVTAIACGSQFNMALYSNGTVGAWGVNTYNQTNVPANLSNVTAIAAGEYHALALSNGAVIAWGNNTYYQCNVPSTLMSNVVAIAAGDLFSLALQSNGTVTAWGNNSSGQCAVPTGLSNVMAIAAGSSFSMALLNNGTIVEWGDNTYGQTNVPQSNASNPVDVRLIAAGGNHAMTAIWSSWVQYPVNVAQDLLLIYNTNSLDSSNVCQYYLKHRPMVSNANVLGIGCQSNNETISPSDYTNVLAYQVQAWLTNNPTKRPSYVILFQDIPTRVNSGGYGATNTWPSVQYQLHYWCSPEWHPFVMAINMNSTNEVTDCEAYINKLQSMGSNLPGRLYLSGSAAGIGNNNFYFDDSRGTAFISYPNLGSNAESGVLAANSYASVTYTNVTPDSTLANHLTNGSNVAGYLCWGWHSALGLNYAINTNVTWSGNSVWWIIRTAESFNGDRNGGGFVTWFASNAFGGMNYGNTPVGAVSYTDEPDAGATFDGTYFGLWESGKNFAICAWNSINTQTAVNFYPQNIGDPFVTK